MNEYTDQIAEYFNKVPMWPLVLLAVGIVIVGIYELIRRKRHAEAVNEYRSAILSTLSGLYPKPTNWPRNIDTYLCARLPVMQEIIENFKPDVAQEDIKAYNKDWDNYCHFCRAEVTDEKCIVADGNSGQEPNPKDKFHTLVSNLLRYAE
ncbi:hypothetical protein [Nitrosovibrio tenuis]|uniref:DUF4381 domain-containing protein n=1 Tax=Nitrosovibrio tenuis TaxID=1233 RepID=A0A1H7G4H8_9PROT|nr:hypothetical protein [Nitrosovibrio tenuis]SEK32377.1 hypothetical protein SAMN05216387_101155 [Nitrosovibrio tenuis]